MPRPESRLTNLLVATAAGLAVALVALGVPPYPDRCSITAPPLPTPRAGWVHHREDLGGIVHRWAHPVTSREPCLACPPQTHKGGRP